MTTEMIPGTVADERALAAAPIADFAMTLEDAAARRRTLVEFVQRQMIDGVDSGRIPGIDKPSLYKPGAEKLCKMFALAIEQEVTQRIERWEDPGFFSYEVTVTLRDKRTGRVEAEGVGSCNSKESKYRWRNTDRACPHCGRPAIIKGRAEYGGGWLCFARKGGCGAKFDDADPAIVGQTIGRVENPDIYDQVNTILKMAAKRALVDATLKAVGASDLFTQDLEDGAVHDAPPSEDAPQHQQQPRHSEPRPMQPRQQAEAQPQGGPREFKNVGELMTAATRELMYTRPAILRALGMAENAPASEIAKYEGGLSAAWERLLERSANVPPAQQPLEAEVVEEGPDYVSRLIERATAELEITVGEFWALVDSTPDDLAELVVSDEWVEKYLTDIRTRVYAEAVGDADAEEE